MRRLVVIAALVVLPAACAPRGAPPAAPLEPARADDAARLIEHGCYRCLVEAVAEADARGDRGQAFEAAALLVLRSKELGLPFDGWLARARELAPLGPASAVYLEIVSVIPPAPLSGSRDAMADLAARLQARTSLPGWREALKSGETSSVFRAYLDVSLVCAFGRLQQDEESFSGPLDAAARTPIYQYRLGACDNTYATRLAALRQSDPEFVDADFFLGRYALEDPLAPDPEAALAYLRSAADAFPASPAVATMIGDVYRGWEEWMPALAAYDEALAASPDHPDAMLGRAISLSRLMRPHEAIEAASRLIDLGQWRLGEAYYWRAWNHLLLEDHEASRRDADRARTLMANAALYVLSGTIEWRLRRLASAEQEFQQALTMDLGECEAALNLGIVRDELGRQDEALSAFQQARQCYELSINVRREAIAAIWGGAGAPSGKMRAAAVHERVLADLLERREDVIRAIGVLANGPPPSQ